MKFVLNPSLEHMALARIGISLWSQNDVRTLMSELSYAKERYLLCEWVVGIEDTVKDKVPQLPLPQFLKEKVFGVIKPIGMQLLYWVMYYRKYDLSDVFKPHLDIPAQLPAELCWTPQGTLDRKRTAEMLVKNETLNIFRRFCLACDYFLEDDIFQLWNSLPQDIKDYRWQNGSVVGFWSYNMTRAGEGQISYKGEFYFCLGYYSSADRNKIGAKYFLQKLTPQEREECLENLVNYAEDADIICFLLPEIKEEDQIKVLEKNPHRVLECFLEWPWQSFFIEVANFVWNFLSKDNYNEVLRAIIGKVQHGYKDYNYRKLFREFWVKSPTALKDSFIEETDKSLLTSLFDIKDKENIKLILKDATLTTKAQLICREDICDLLTLSIRRNQWDFLKFFIREFLPSEREMLKFKQELEKRTYFKKCSGQQKRIWNKLFHFSDDSICESDKKNVEQGESSSSK